MAEVVRIVRFMWGNGAETWEDLLRSGVVVPLFKKGDRNNPGNYRGVCLLSMGSRIVARIVACRLREWAEAMGLMDDNQAGFRRWEVDGGCDADDGEGSGGCGGLEEEEGEGGR